MHRDQIRDHAVDQDLRGIDEGDIEMAGVEGVNGRNDIVIEIERGREVLVVDMVMERIGIDKEIVRERDIRDGIDIGMKIENEESIDRENGERMEQRMRHKVIIIVGMRIVRFLLQ